jgi:histidyl-tRNA synthetase
LNPESQIVKPKLKIMASKPSIPKGTRDFSPAEVANVNISSKLLRIIFEKFGFQPIETPSFENSETLMGNMEKKEIV